MNLDCGGNILLGILTGEISVRGDNKSPIRTGLKEDGTRRSGKIGTEVVTD